MNDTEREAIILNAAWEMIDGMVNWGMFVKNEQTGPTNLLFKTPQHSQLFIILLGDFLADIRAFKGEAIPFDLKPVPTGARPSDLTFLFHLRQVCANPQLGYQAERLHASIEAFATWLETEFIAHEVNLHVLDNAIDLRVSRYRYLKMCGDIAKHNLARLATNVSHLRKLIEAAGQSITEQQAYLAIESFSEWFHEDIFIYHSSHIAEFLNNLRWDIYHYLCPEYARSWHTVDASPMTGRYGYHVPASITEPVARAMYWDVMNRVRSKPYVHRFVVSESFKACH